MAMKDANTQSTADFREEDWAGGLRAIRRAELKRDVRVWSGRGVLGLLLIWTGWGAFERETALVADDAPATIGTPAVEESTAAPEVVTGAKLAWEANAWLEENTAAEPGIVLELKSGPGHKSQRIAEQDRQEPRPVAELNALPFAEMVSGIDGGVVLGNWNMGAKKTYGESFKRRPDLSRVDMRLAWDPLNNGAACMLRVRRDVKGSGGRWSLETDGGLALDRAEVMWIGRQTASVFSSASATHQASSDLAVAAATGAFLMRNWGVSGGGTGRGSRHSTGFGLRIEYVLARKVDLVQAGGGALDEGWTETIDAGWGRVEEEMPLRLRPSVRWDFAVHPRWATSLEGGYQIPLPHALHESVSFPVQPPKAMIKLALIRTS